ncbi:MAG: addiction module toxin, HicA family [Dehalococcoidia bacterium]|nr:addiction module toxin, HicA family [Dehalococcoidia bacterium]
MPRPRPARTAEVVRVLTHLGFVRVRQSGSHATYRHPGGRWVILPVHEGKDISTGVMRKILNDADLTPEDFEKL